MISAIPIVTQLRECRTRDIFVIFFLSITKCVLLFPANVSIFSSNSKTPIASSTFSLVTLFFLLLFVYTVISYKTSRKKGGKSPNVSAPSAYNPSILLFPKKSLFFFMLDKLLLLIVAAVILALGLGFCYLAQCHLH